jgi:hypothetical protein
MFLLALGEMNFVVKEIFNKASKPPVLEKIADTKKLETPKANDQLRPTPPPMAPAGPGGMVRGSVGIREARIAEAKTNAAAIQQRQDAAKASGVGLVKAEGLTHEFNRKNKL